MTGTITKFELAMRGGDNNQGVHRKPVWILRRNGKRVTQSTNVFSMETRMEREARREVAKEGVTAETTCFYEDGTVSRRNWTPDSVKEYDAWMDQWRATALGQCSNPPMGEQ